MLRCRIPQYTLYCNVGSDTYRNRSLQVVRLSYRERASISAGIRAEPRPLSFMYAGSGEVTA